MPKFSLKSLVALAECHPDLQRLFERVVERFDCSVLDGKRTLAEQEKNVAKGVSKTLDSKHLPRNEKGELDENGKSHAADVMPYPFDWSQIQRGLDAAKRADPNMQMARAYYFAGYVRGVADEMGIKIRQGVDWDGDTVVGDQSFIDLPHAELDD